MRLSLELGVKGLKLSPLMPWGRARYIGEFCYPEMEDRVMLIQRATSVAKEIGIKLQNELYLDVGEPHETPFGCPVVMGLTLLPNADVIPCEVFAEAATDVTLGNLVRQDLREIWESSKSRAIRDSACIMNKMTCRTCPYLDICGSYCIAEIYLKYRDFQPSTEYFTYCKRAWRHMITGQDFL